MLAVINMYGSAGSLPVYYTIPPQGMNTLRILHWLLCIDMVKTHTCMKLSGAVLLLTCLNTQLSTYFDTYLPTYIHTLPARCCGPWRPLP